MPETYCFDTKLKIWKPRTRSTEKGNPVLGRIYPVSPRDPERFALYVLTKHFPGHYEDL